MPSCPVTLSGKFLDILRRALLNEIGENASAAITTLISLNYYRVLGFSTEQRSEGFNVFPIEFFLARLSKK